MVRSFVLAVAVAVAAAAPSPSSPSPWPRADTGCSRCPTARSRWRCTTPSPTPLSPARPRPRTPCATSRPSIPKARPRAWPVWARACCCSTTSNTRRRSRSCSTPQIAKTHLEDHAAKALAELYEKTGDFAEGGRALRQAGRAAGPETPSAARPSCAAAEVHDVLKQRDAGPGDDPARARPMPRARAPGPAPARRGAGAARAAPRGRGSAGPSRPRLSGDAAGREAAARLRKLADAPAPGHPAGEDGPRPQEGARPVRGRRAPHRGEALPGPPPPQARPPRTRTSSTSAWAARSSRSASATTRRAWPWPRSRRARPSSRRPPTSSPGSRRAGPAARPRTARWPRASRHVLGRGGAAGRRRVLRALGQGRRRAALLSPDLRRLSAGQIRRPRDLPRGVRRISRRAATTRRRRSSRPRPRRAARTCGGRRTSTGRGARAARSARRTARGPSSRKCWPATSTRTTASARARRWAACPRARPPRHPAPPEGLAGRARALPHARPQPAAHRPAGGGDGRARGRAPEPDRAGHAELDLLAAGAAPSGHHRHEARLSGVRDGDAATRCPTPSGGSSSPSSSTDLLTASAGAAGVDPALVAAVIRQESTFDPGAVSAVGAHGLMQIMPPTGRALARAAGIKKLAVSQLHDPARRPQAGHASTCAR